MSTRSILDSGPAFFLGLLGGTAISFFALSYAFRIPLFTRDVPPAKFKCELVEYR